MQDLRCNGDSWGLPAVRGLASLLSAYLELVVQMDLIVMIQQEGSGTVLHLDTETVAECGGYCVLSTSRLRNR